MESERGKLFVGGISFETTEETLRGYFSKYGQVAEAVIMKDRFSGDARGFGFVLFSDPDLADKALQDKHVILSRTVEVRKAVPRGGRHQKSHHSRKNWSNGSGGNTHQNQFSTKKIFVGGLAATVTEEEFKAYFEKFGGISDVVVMYDSVTHRARGFGFITFDSEEAVENVMQQTFHMLQNKFVEVKRAVPKDGMSANTGNNNNYTNNRSTGVGARGGLTYGMYHGGIFPRFGPTYNTYMSYPSPIYPYGAYTIGGYGGVGLGPAPRSPWNVPGLISIGRGPVPYGNAPFYPGYANGFVGGYTGMSTTGYPGINRQDTNGQDRNLDTQLGTGASPMRLDGEKSDDKSLDNTGNGVPVDSKQNQGQTGLDGEFKPYTDANSS